MEIHPCYPIMQLFANLSSTLLLLGGYEMLCRTQKDKEHPYVMLNKTFLDDPNLSLSAKGLLAYCMSKPDGWHFQVSQLEKVLKEGKHAINAAFKELVEFRYCVQYQENSNGRFSRVERVIFETPQSQEELKKLLPQTNFPLPGNSVPENPPLVNNEVQNNKQHVVVVKREDARCSISKQNAPKDSDFTKDDLYAMAVRTRKDWTSEEIEGAWNAFKKCKIPITSPIDYIEGIIKKQRVIKQSKKEKTKYKRETICNQKQINISKTSSEKDKEILLEPVTRERPLAKYAFLSGQKKN